MTRTTATSMKADELDSLLMEADLDAVEPVRFYGRNLGWNELSNFYPSLLQVGSVEYATVEHFYQAMKAESIRDHERVRVTKTPGDAKRLGQKITLRGDWEDIRDNVMRIALVKKFSIPKLREVLLSTGDREIIEASPTDYYWGEGRKGNGKNMLGVLLQEVRAAILEDRLDKYEIEALRGLP